jgi:hypothetical protein
MSKLHGDQPRHEEVRVELGELRKPDDRSDQPGQGADLTPPNDGHARDLRRDGAAEPRTETAPAGAPRQGSRNA